MSHSDTSLRPVGDVGHLVDIPSSGAQPVTATKVVVRPAGSDRLTISFDQLVSYCFGTEFRKSFLLGPGSYQRLCEDSPIAAELILRLVLIEGIDRVFLFQYHLVVEKALFPFMWEGKYNGSQSTLIEQVMIAVKWSLPGESNFVDETPGHKVVEQTLSSSVETVPSDASQALLARPQRSVFERMMAWIRGD